MSKRNSPDYDRGYEDKSQERYDPPDGTGFVAEIGRSIFGPSKADSDYHSGQKKASSDGKGSGGCFLTTACIRARALDDDCFELRTLRQFRDNYVVAQPGGHHLVAEYYRMAPAVVDAIDARADRDSLYGEIYDQLVAPCVSLIVNGKPSEALSHYRSTATALATRLAASATPT